MPVKRAKTAEPVQKLYSITEGTVIDHIPAGQALRVLQILGIDPGTTLLVSVGMNLSSRKRGSKDMVKVEGKLLTKAELSKLALIASGATINHISKGKVQQKFLVEVPQVFIGVAECQNLNCITGHQPVQSKFYTIKQKPLKLCCVYCERIMDGNQAVLR